MLLEGCKLFGLTPLARQRLNVTPPEGEADEFERFLSQGQPMQVAGFALIPLDISDFPTRHNYGLALTQNHIERILAAWGIDGHNSHTNICSSGSREGYQLWMGLDRPSPDHANAKVILLISAHLESGHYFNPHAQRVIDGKTNGAKLIVFDTRLSHTATHADYWVSPYPGSEPAILLAIANYIIQNNLYDREFVETWWNWREYMELAEGSAGRDFRAFEQALKDLYKTYTFEFAAT